MYCLVNIRAVSVAFAQHDAFLDTKGLYSSCLMPASETWETYLTSLHFNFLIQEMRDNNTFAAGSLLVSNTVTHVKCLVDCIFLPNQEKLSSSSSLLF